MLQKKVKKIFETLILEIRLFVRKFFTLQWSQIRQPEKIKKRLETKRLKRIEVTDVTYEEEDAIGDDLIVGQLSLLTCLFFSC